MNSSIENESDKRQEKPTPSPQEVSGLQQQPPRDRFAESGSNCLRSLTQFFDALKTQPTAPILLERAAASARRRWSSENSDIYSATTIDAATPIKTAAQSNSSRRSSISRAKVAAGEDGETWQRIAMQHLAAGDQAAWIMDTAAGAAQLFFSDAVFWAGLFMLSGFGPESMQAATATATTNNNNKAQMAEYPWACS
ncbi:hypothetical protein DL764_003469 [Monosporascus ibericus]|uniref:Uncharacterized protein n=1 Tax=Monosporascus ibericus TaxID=155417 RepID=A0A4Q4TGG8_9PEZI|nr:hypothetical protein DL764_003469 [Monosporascus ibericus]